LSVTSRCVLATASAAALAVVVLSPALDRLADASFAWHMLQHLVLFFLVPLLALLGQPFAYLSRAMGKTRTAAFVRATKGLHVLGSPVAGYGALLATMWLTHFSPLYELSLDHEWIHVLEHGLYVAGGTLFWLPVVAPPPLRPMSYPARAFYLFLALPQSALLGAALFAARAPLYAHYAALMPVARALADQHDAAAIVWMGSGLAVLCAMLATIGVWAAREAEAT
jgi:putative membrane protein